jgi:DGQHR domain-containing protein
MLATRVLQKEGTFYFIAYPAAELLDRVNFSSRYYFEGEQIEADEPGDDEVARFIAGVEKSERSFQRLLNRRKIRQIVNFYETAVSQPLIPGTILLFTDETLRFRRSDSSESVGFLSEPNGKYLIIDGQHRLAALHFFRQKHPDRKIYLQTVTQRTAHTLPTLTQ